MRMNRQTVSDILPLQTDIAVLTPTPGSDDVLKNIPILHGTIVNIYAITKRTLINVFIVKMKVMRQKKARD